MKIVMISSLWERTPPEKYGGTERVVHHLTEELVHRGHEVTLFATGDSRSKAKLISVYPHPLYRDGIPWGEAYWPLINVAKAIEEAMRIKADIIHHHSQYYGYPFAPISPIPMVHTHHGNLDPKIIEKGKVAILKAFKDNYYVSISNNQRKPMPDLNWIATVYNGVDVESYSFHSRPKNYLVWLGRFSWKKGPKEAILVAKKLGRQLIMAAKIEKGNLQDYQYYLKEIKPLIDGKQIKYAGEVAHNQKNQILKNAYCLLNPINWEEPFGLIPIEANACGCPVVAFARGSMPELIKEGVNGYLVKPGDVGRMIRAVKKIDQVDRHQCRKWAEENFSVQKMVDGYEKVYQEVIKDWQKRKR